VIAAQTTPEVADDDREVGRCDVLGGHDQVALVLPVLVVDTTAMPPSAISASASPIVLRGRGEAGRWSFSVMSLLL